VLIGVYSSGSTTLLPCIYNSFIFLHIYISCFSESCYRRKTEIWVQRQGKKRVVSMFWSHITSVMEILNQAYWTVG